jgi:UDP-N-acetylmuramate dehydrogenase
MTDVATSLREELGVDRVRADVPLAPMTTFRVGGKADWLVETRSSAELVAALRAANRLGIAATILGGGSNVLVADAGVCGLVIRPRGGEIVQAAVDRVRADSAVTVNGLVRWTINRGCSGLEAWAGTPGTIGGAIYGNAHFGGRSIGDLVDSVRVASRSGDAIDVPASAMEFAYDRSRVQRTREIVVSATFRVGRGDPHALRATAKESLSYRKRTQPLDTPSAGCVFQNPDPGRGDRVPEGIPWSAGALVDRAGLKGATVGGARVSPTHANFIVNDGHATAAEIRALIDRCRAAVRDRFGVELREEIVYVGAWEGDMTD